MFGTTRKTENNKDGEGVFIWRVALDPTNNFVDVNSLIGSRLMLDDYEPERRVRGIHSKLLGSNSDVIHLVF